MKRAVGAVGSVLLHLVLIFSLVAATGRADAPPGHLNESDIQLLDEGHELRQKKQTFLHVPVTLPPLDGVAGNIDPPCLGDSYHGIGIRGIGSVVLDVGPDTPAARAGLTAEDTIQNEEILGRNRYPDGTELHLLVERNGSVRNVTIVTAEICD